MGFRTFSKMISDIPAKAVLKALDLECKSLELDLELHRSSFDEDSFSILCFRQFVRMVKEGESMRCLTPLPSDHLEFYRETIDRLMKADNLPASAMEQFDYTFRFVP
jgi:hypothetical protein